ncbi:MAG: glycogen/starch/alpha-glucan phosphorylase [Streptococcus salivarius]
MTEKHGFEFDEAVAIVSKMVGYTNHTILAEALEKWPLDYLEEVVPHLVVIIKKLDAIVRGKFDDPRVQIIDEHNRVHMAPWISTSYKRKRCCKASHRNP